MNKKRPRIMVFAACILGYTYIFLKLYLADDSGMNLLRCYFKTITGLPCPACGTTGAVLLILQGDFFSALKMNPLVLLQILFLSLAPIILLLDLVLNKDYLSTLYSWLDAKTSLYSFIILVVINWIYLLAT